eukprot:4302457-Pyramimonas_sp.AAC.1
MTRVSRISRSSRGSTPGRCSGAQKSAPLGVTVTSPPCCSAASAPGGSARAAAQPRRRGRVMGLPSSGTLPTQVE